MRNAAQPVRLLQDRVEHWREVAGRRVDDLQHLGGRGLLLQSLARLSYEPRVLHCNYRLRGEVLQQRDLLVGERPNLVTVDVESADEDIVFTESNAEKRSKL